MEAMVARLLTIILLSHEQRLKLRDYERKMAPRECLMPFEIIRMFRVHPSIPNEEETNRLDHLYREWDRRILWKKNQIESKNHETLCISKCICRTRQQEIHEWEDWAMQNFDKAPEDVDWSDPERPFGTVLREMGVRMRVIPASR